MFLIRRQACEDHAGTEWCRPSFRRLPRTDQPIGCRLLRAHLDEPLGRTVIHLHLSGARALKGEIHVIR